VDYFFVSDEEFNRLVATQGLLEWAEVFDHRYGTPRNAVEAALEGGDDVVLEIDVQGARQVKDAMSEAVLVLLEPPSMAELERRLRSRGTEDEERIARRLAKARWELEQRTLFDHEVVNDDVERASAQVAAIIQASPPTDEGRTHP
jgi:guanylate kinase